MKILEQSCSTNAAWLKNKNRADLFVSGLVKRQEASLYSQAIMSVAQVKVASVCGGNKAQIGRSGRSAASVRHFAAEFRCVPSQDFQRIQETYWAMGHTRCTPPERKLFGGME